MATSSSPTVWRRWLAMELRRMREDREIPQREAARVCGWSGARLSYIENAQQNVVEEDLDKLLELYEVPEDKQTQYYEATQRSQEKGWWERYQRFMPDFLGLLVPFEQGAAAIRSFHPVVLPGLLQTSAYATAVVEADVWPRTPAQIDRMIELRQTRQQIILRDDDPLNLHVILDEATLRHVARDASTMSEQLDHVVAVAERPNVTVQVLPFARGVQSYALGEFQIFDFPWDSDPGLVYLELRDQTVYLEEVHEIDGYALAFQHLCDRALTPDQSIAMMRDVSEEYAQQ